VNHQILKNLRQQLSQQRHRALVILSGSSEWQALQLERLWTKDETVWWIGPENCAINPQALHYAFESINTQQLPHKLGQEVDGVILDASKGLSANTLGIAAGMIKAGGLFILCTPDLESWQNLPNTENARFLNSPFTIEQAYPYFIQHLIKQWQNLDNQVVWLSENQPIVDLPFDLPSDDSSNPPTLVPAVSQNLPTSDQQQAIQAIHTVAFGHRKRPLVLSADRGRGKSSVLGLAVVQCLLEGKTDIVLTASRLDQTQMAFEHASRAIIKAAETQEISIVSNQPGLVSFHFQNQLKTFKFIAPDQLVIEPTLADVLMVDEAAHLPTPLLTQLLHRHHRMVFATTLHGYEGSGRGFELRFKKTLNKRTPDWKNLPLKQPIRWADNDPLETAINQALLLTPKQIQLAPEEMLASLPANDLQLQEESIHTLVENPEQLHAVFELLVQAHYQTSPNDLQQLLSAPNLRVLSAKQDQLLVGVVLCVEEGKIMPTSTRVHGHLVPQLLLKNYASDDFTMLTTWRVMRIAVHPNYQQKGIGKKLLKILQSTAKKARIDYLSSSFGASNELLPFWFDRGYTPLHIGVKRDKSSGSHNVVVTLPLTAMAQQALACIQRAFQEQFPHTLIESLHYEPANRVLAILKTFRFKSQKPHLEAAASQYAWAQRQYESISGQLWEWSIRNPQTLGQASKKQQAVWCDKVLKKQSWEEVAHHNHLPGRKGVETVLQEMLIEILPKPRKIATQRIIKPTFGR